MKGVYQADLIAITKTVNDQITYIECIMSLLVCIDDLFVRTWLGFSKYWWFLNLSRRFISTNAYAGYSQLNET